MGGGMRREHAVLVLHGIERAGGIDAIEAALRGAPGVQWAYISTTLEMAYVEFDPDRIDRARLEAIVEGTDAGARGDDIGSAANHSTGGHP